MADIVLINPRFEASMYGLEYAVPFVRAKAASPLASLPLLAALTPSQHSISLIDENVESIDFDRCAGADIVGVTGMMVQQARMIAIIRELKSRGVLVVVGGPLATVREDLFEGCADVIFVGEAEETWPQFLSEWQEGRHQRRYEQSTKTDMSSVPVPRYDLLKMRRYAFGTVQFSRGCPFTCEFCDIIVVFGRRPRFKTKAQVVAELDALLKHGVEHAILVDDNLVANKKAIKEVLRTVIEWQEANGYPMSFLAEASLDLAEDSELMRLMVEANIIIVFVGIESPNEAALRETKKLQNLRKGGSMIDKVHAIQRAGLEVWCGMVLGFDNDDASIFAEHRRFITEARIVNPLINLLVAIPGTPLHARLKAAGRLDFGEEHLYGTNVIPLQMSRAELREGSFVLARDLYQAPAYFDRLEALYFGEGIDAEPARKRYLRRHRWRWIKTNAIFLIQAGAILLSLLRVPEAELSREYRQRMWQALKRRRDPILLRIYALKCAVHYHMHVILREHDAKGATPFTAGFGLPAPSVIEARPALSLDQGASQSAPLV
jgi:radical SAM superfamily enzyme YgiQ (UPF0313 family)